MDFDKIANLILKYESYRSQPYDDQTGKTVLAPEGKVTIGIGRNISDKGISFDEANFLLANDIKEVSGRLQLNFPWFGKLDDVRQAVLIDMGFNLGIQGLYDFKNTLELIAAGKYKDASTEMLKSKWASQVGQRASELSNMMYSGSWPNGLA